MTTLTPRQIEENRTFPFTEYMVDPARKLVGIAIPKSGCSDLKHWFVSLIEPEKLTDPTFRLHAHCRAAYSLSRVPPEQRAGVLRDSFTFTFVRDPFSRVVSAYVEKFVRPAPDGLFESARDVVRHIAGNREGGGGITFREFVQFLAHVPDDHMDLHWRPQASYLSGVRVDLLGRMESIPSILNELGRGLGMSPREATRRNSTGYTTPTGRNVADTLSSELHRAGALPPMSDLEDESLRQQVGERFRQDVMLYEAAVDHLPNAIRERISVDA